MVSQITNKNYKIIKIVFVVVLYHCNVIKTLHDYLYIRKNGQTHTMYWCPVQTIPWSLEGHNQSWEGYLIAPHHWLGNERYQQTWSSKKIILWFFLYNTFRLRLIREHRDNYNVYSLQVWGYINWDLKLILLNHSACFILKFVIAS